MNYDCSWVHDGKFNQKYDVMQSSIRNKLPTRYNI